MSQGIDAITFVLTLASFVKALVVRDRTTILKDAEDLALFFSGMPNVSKLEELANTLSAMSSHVQLPKPQFSTGNSKVSKLRRKRVAYSTGRTYIKRNAATWGIPALRTSYGVVTCPGAGACAGLCFAREGRYFENGPRFTRERNFLASLLPTFAQDAINAIRKGKWSLIRIHDSGDFYSKEYLASWIAIAKALPRVTFYAYTKSIPLVRSMTSEIPSNFRITFSLGSKHDNEIDTDKDAHSRIFESVSDLKKAGYGNGSETDYLATMPNRGKIGLVYHGKRKVTNLPVKLRQSIGLDR